MIDQITQQLALISDAVRRIEELIAPQIPSAPMVPQVTPVPGMAIKANQNPVPAAPSPEVTDSFQAAILDWQKGIKNYSTVVWLKNGMNNWVDSVDPAVSTEALGCSMAFISYLIHQGLTLEAIEDASPPGTTPAQAYQTLNQGMADQAWSVFSGVLRALGSRVTSSDPFSMMQSAHRVRPINHV